jgi:hypothetical protein
MLLSSAETTRLLAVLPRDDLEFGAVAKEFAGAFEPKDRFKACCAVVLLLEVCGAGTSADWAGRAAVAIAAPPADGPS